MIIQFRMVDKVNDFPSVIKGNTVHLIGLAREVLRSQPSDIYAFGAAYFDNLLKAKSGKFNSFYLKDGKAVITNFSTREHSPHGDVCLRLVLDLVYSSIFQ